MKSNDDAVRRYFGSADDRFWKWQDSGESVGWTDGKTIAFSQELKSLLSHLAPLGLPRFGSLLLLVASTRTSWSVEGSESGILAGMLKQDADSHRFVTSGNSDLLKKVLKGLHRIRDLAPELRTSLPAKKAIAEIVFAEQASEYSQRESQSIAESIRPGLSQSLDATRGAVSVGYSPLMLLKDLAELARGLDAVSAQRIRLQMRTGIDTLPIPAPVDEIPDDLPPSQSARALIERLRESPEQAGIAQIASRLLANVSLPRKLTEAQDQELGGFSDITNRGTPDRLLLTELAQDSLTLAVRVAMNEAMYLHRETPPNSPQMERQILIDSGVRSWGVTRLFAAAAALAFVAKSSGNDSVQVWRGHGKELVPAKIWTREGLTDHLAALESDPHVADAIPALTKQITTNDPAVEVVLIMPEESYRDEYLRESLKELNAGRLFIVTLDSNGEFHLRHRMNRGEKLVRSAKLDLRQLLETKSHVVRPEGTRPLPSFFRMAPPPFLMSASPSHQRCWLVQDRGALSITPDGRLLHWTRPSHGAEEIYDQIPKGELLWTRSNTIDGITRFAVGGMHKATLIEVNLNNRRVSSVSFQCDQITGIMSHGDFLFCYSRNQNLLFEINPSTGAINGQLEVPPNLRWQRTRFFTDSRGVPYAFSHDGHSLTLDRLDRFADLNHRYVAFWDADGFEGPLALTVDGQLIGESTNPLRLPRCDMEIGKCQVESVSADGLMIRGSCKSILRNLHCNSFEIRLGPSSSFRTASYLWGGSLEPRIHSVIRSMTVRKKFRSIGLTPEGHLALRSTKGRLATFHFRNGQPLFDSLLAKTKLNFEQPFEPLQLQGPRYKLQMASWAGGCKAVLDSRGLLHLIPNDPDVPETSIVLTEGELTAWCTDGRTIGKSYFLNRPEQHQTKPGRRREFISSTLDRFVEQIRASD